MIKRIYHPYEKWEDYKAGFYDNISGEKKKELLLKVVELFSSKKLTKKYMQKVINEWTYSCEHNLSNYSMNRIAYLGQSACCLFAGIPSTITMEGWNMVSKENRDIADKIADKLIQNWEKEYSNKQLCLKLD